MMIDVEIIKPAGGVQAVGSALNDAFVTNGAFAGLIEIDLFCDNVKITHYRADGVIIATPTGSTAYSMSAGGPVIDPNISCLCVTPICPHSLINRSVIFSHDSALEVRNRSADAYLTVITKDGRINQKLGDGDIVRVTKSLREAKLISVKNRGFFDIIREKISES
jgi:NAD+ kinase